MAIHHSAAQPRHMTLPVLPRFDRGAGVGESHGFADLYVSAPDPVKVFRAE